MPGINLTEWARDVLTSLGYPGVAILVIIESVFPPIPSEIILPLAGFLASEGEFQVVLLIGAATVGSVLGALVPYVLARSVSMGRLEYWFERYGPYALTGPEDLERSIEWFDRYARWAVLLGRLAPGIRSLISIPAGVARMNLAEFIVLTAIGSAIWNAALILTGWLLGSQWSQASEYTDIFELIVIAAIGITVVSFVARRLRQRWSS